jgi:hypothetical protein
MIPIRDKTNTDVKICLLEVLPMWRKTTISNAGILKRVFRKPPGAPGKVRVPPGPGRVRVALGPTAGLG